MSAQGVFWYVGIALRLPVPICCILHCDLLVGLIYDVDALVRLHR